MQENSEKNKFWVTDFALTYTFIIAYIWKNTQYTHSKTVTLFLLNPRTRSFANPTKEDYIRAILSVFVPSQARPLLPVSYVVTCVLCQSLITVPSGTRVSEKFTSSRVFLPGLLPAKPSERRTYPQDKLTAVISRLPKSKPWRIVAA